MTNKLLMHFVCILLLLTQSCGKNYNSQSSSLKEITLASDCLVSPDGDIVYFYKYPNDVVWRHSQLFFTNFNHESGTEYRLLIHQIEDTNCFEVVAQLKSEKKKSSGLPHLTFDPAFPNDSCEIEVAFPEKRKLANTISPNAYKLDSLYIIGGDIVLTEDAFKDYISTKAGYRKQQYWSSGIVHYTYAPGFSYANLVQQAISEWSNKTGLHFVYGTDSKGYIEFFSDSGPYSTAEGKVGGKQRISLDSSCTVGNAIHEIGHAVGLIHEHCRPDRDSYIIIYDNNIMDGKESQFEKFSWYEASPFGYMDDGSIMMYHSWAFSKNTLPTMKHVDGTYIYNQRDSLSVGDVACIKSIYGPPYHKLI